MASGAAHPGGGAAGAGDGRLLQKLLSLVLQEKLVTGIDEKSKVVEFKHPEELKQLLKLSVDREGRTLEEAEAMMKKVVQYSVKTQHPHFCNQQYHGIDEVALAGAWLSEALNTNGHTFEAAPVFVLVEYFVISKLLSLTGWKDGDGIFSPGGSLSTAYSMVLARYKRHPQVKKTGIWCMKPLVAFVSDQSHYSFMKAAAWLGMGQDNVVKVATDDRGRMLPQALREAVAAARARGCDPYFVGASCGTTVLGSFDPLEDVADVCQQEGLWLHVDGCWGATVLLSSQHRHLMAGVERADSMSWNPHKMLGAPIQCSLFVLRHKGLLHQCNSASATYLFQQDKFYDTSYDTGDKSFQCGRKVDAFKLYVLLSLHGLDELERRIDAAFEASEYLWKQVVARPGFRMVVEPPQCTNTCFWFVPPSLRGLPETPDWWQKLGKVAAQVKARMVQEGSLMVGYQPVQDKGLVNFFRMVNTCYPTPTTATMDYVLDQIERMGNDL